jgi:hypothetical protein
MDDQLTDLRHSLRAWPGKPMGNPLLLLSGILNVGPVGGSLLAEELAKRSSLFERTLLAAALGDAAGDAGLEELRQCSRETKAGSSDLRGAATISMAARFGPAVTPDLIDRLHDSHPHVRRSALVCVAAVGDERAWDPVWALFLKLLSRPPRLKSPSDLELLAFCYLIRHLSSDRSNDLAKAIIGSWPRMRPELRSGFAEVIPGLPDSQPLDDANIEFSPDAARDWLRRGFARILHNTI